MTIKNLKLAQALFPMLTAALLAVGCSDSTGPSKEESSTKAAPETPAPSGQTTTPSEDKSGAPAPTLEKVPAAGDSASSAGSALRLRASWIDRRYTTQPGIVYIPRGSAICFSSPREPGILTVQGINITITGGLSALYPQSTTAEVWFYRWNGSSWVYQAGAKVSTRMDLNATIPTTHFLANQHGHYRVMVRLTQYANIAGWVKTAVTQYDFDGQAEYTGNMGFGPGYCTL